MDMTSELKRRIEHEDWSYIARMAHAFELEVGEREKEGARLHKELQMVRKVIHAYLSHEQGREKFLSAKFLMRLHRTIRKLDEKFAQHRHMHSEFLTFLRTLLHKMKQEKLVVYKVLEKTREFQRHKGFGEAL